MLYITKNSEYVKKDSNGAVYCSERAISTDDDVVIVLDAPLIAYHPIRAKTLVASCVATRSDDSLDMGIESHKSITAKEGIYVIGHLMSKEKITCRGDICTTGFISAPTIKAKGKLVCNMIGTYYPNCAPVESVECGKIACGGEIMCSNVMVGGKAMNTVKENNNA